MLIANAYRIYVAPVVAEVMVGPGNVRELEKLLNEQSYWGRPALILPEALAETVLKNRPLRWRPPNIMNP
ncbi:MAG TPA: hypothetical protein VIX17_04495 [Pyrinomonadaceae bacterium]